MVFKKNIILSEKVFEIDTEEDILENLRKSE